VKEEIIGKLKELSGEYVSGEQLSESLGVTRTAVWKCVAGLRKEGYVIESSSKKGYRLKYVPDIINSWEIKRFLNTCLIGKDVLYFPQIDSTNNHAKKIAMEGCPEGTVVVADCQTNGRGRLGRDWSSLDKKGIWMSVVLRPVINFEEVQAITLAASVAVVNSIRDTLGIETGIKWPNDIILDGKKVCGILTEMSLEMERVNFLVIGIGINVNQETEDFPEEIRHKAVALKNFATNGIDSSNNKIRRSELIKSVLRNLEEVYGKLTLGKMNEIIGEWKRHSFTLGREVCINLKDMQYTGIARGITSGGKLVVDCNDGITREVLSGEVSVRGLMGYI
jgi:BirA family biotin operon repressor/biotin-[acetyl-CoA-carboxylase] ligase